MNLQIIFYGILGVVSAVYLTTIFFKPGLLQYVLKGFLILIIFLIYIFNTDADKIIIPIILSLIFAWAGDILLIKIDNLLCFRLGLASFLTGHICYIIAMVGLIGNFNIPILIVSLVIGAVLGFLLFKFVKPPKEMRIPVIAYETVIITMSIFALQVLFFNPATFAILIFIGSLCFVTSDGTLALVTFRKKPFYFFCMLTYIAAQFLLVLGFSGVGG
jgi:uncharacterized membrane protein YhhN